MERSAQPHDVKDSATATRDRSETEGAPPPLDPHFTNDLPHPGHSGESDGTPPDPDASYENDVPGPIPLEPGRPQVAEQIDGAFDIDWFSVELDAGRTYVFHVRGEATGDGTLEDPAFGGLWFDPDGDGANLQPVSGYQQLDSGHGTNAVLTFTPAQSGTYCFAEFAQDWSLRSATGSYSVEVYDDTGVPGALIGTDSADRLDGDEQSNVMSGLDGDNETHGCGGDDEIRGGDGDKFLVGGRDPDPPHLPPEEFADPYPPYVPWEEFADPGTPYAPPDEFADPGTPYAPPDEFADPYPPYVPWEEFADPGTPYAPPDEFGEAHGNSVDCANPGIPDFLLAWVNLHAEPAEADAM